MEGRRSGATVAAALQSPPTRSAPAEPGLVADALALFGYAVVDLDPRIPPAMAEAGARHLVLTLKSRASLAAMAYDLAAGRIFMRAAEVATVTLAYAETPQRFHARNPFAAGGITKTRRLVLQQRPLPGISVTSAGRMAGGIDIVQGEDMGMRSRLRAEIPPARGTTIRVSGTARRILP